MLFAALVICLSSSMLNDGRVFANPDIEFVKSIGRDPQGGGIFDGDGGAGSNNYLIIAIAGIAIVAAVLLIIKFVIPKFRAK